MVMAHHISFKYAWEGIQYAYSTQPNFRYHSLFALIAVLIGLWLNISANEWLILLLTITLVIVAEMINTAIESMTDLIHDQHHKHAKIAKDVSAGMVLVSAIGSVVIGAVIFLPKIF
jgi:diacylglycerol kinase (ATP)